MDKAQESEVVGFVQFGKQIETLSPEIHAILLFAG